MEAESWAAGRELWWCCNYCCLIYRWQYMSISAAQVSRKSNPPWQTTKKSLVYLSISGELSTFPHRPTPPLTNPGKPSCHRPIYASLNTNKILHHGGRMTVLSETRLCLLHDWWVVSNFAMQILPGSEIRRLTVNHQLRIKCITLAQIWSNGIFRVS